MDNCCKKNCNVSKKCSLRHEALNNKGVSRKFKKSYKLEEVQEWKAKKEGSLLQLWHQRPFCQKMSQKKQIWKNKFKGSSQVAITSKTELFVTTLSIFSICKDAWFVDYGTSQHLIFKKKIFSTFEEFTLNHKMYFGNNNIKYV